MRWTKRAAGIAAASIVLGAVGMLAAHAGCQDTGTFVGEVGYDMSACDRDATVYDSGGYTGRYSRPLYLWASDREQVAWANTQAYVSQDRWAHTPSRTTYRDTILTAARWGNLGAVDQYYSAGITGRQTRWMGPNSSNQTTTADVSAYSSGAATVQGEVYAQQYRYSGACKQNASVYLRVEGTTSYSPVQEHDCPVEAPLAPDFP